MVDENVSPVGELSTRTMHPSIAAAATKTDARAMRGRSKASPEMEYHTVMQGLAFAGAVGVRWQHDYGRTEEATPP